MSMLSSKKAQGLSLNTIIIAIIVLIVLVVIVMIFTGYFGKIFTPGVKACVTSLGGQCSDTACTAEQRQLSKYTTVAQAQSAGCTTTAVTSYCCSQSFI